MLIDIYRELLKDIQTFSELPKGTKVQIGETECRESSISVLISVDNSRTKWDICGAIRYVYNLKLIYYIEAQTNEKKYKVYKFFEDLIEYLNKKEKETYSSIDAESVPELKSKNMNGLDVFELNCLLYP